MGAFIAGHKSYHQLPCRRAGPASWAVERVSAVPDRPRECRCIRLGWKQWSISPPEGGQHRRGGFESKYRATIAPPTAEAFGFRVFVYLVVVQALRRIVMPITAAPAIDADSEVLESGLPVVAGI